MSDTSVQDLAVVPEVSAAVRMAAESTSDQVGEEDVKTQLNALLTPATPGHVFTMPLLTSASAKQLSSRLLAEANTWDEKRQALFYDDGIKAPESINAIAHALVDDVLAPLVRVSSKGIHSLQLASASVVAYKQGGSAHKMHMDAADITVNLCLGDDFKGGNFLVDPATEKDRRIEPMLEPYVEPTTKKLSGFSGTPVGTLFPHFKGGAYEFDRRFMGNTFTPDLDFLSSSASQKPSTPLMSASAVRALWRRFYSEKDHVGAEGQRPEDFLQGDLNKVRSFLMVPQQPGHAIVFPGRTRHGAMSVVDGVRVNLVLFLKVQCKLPGYMSLPRDLQLHILSFVGADNVKDIVAFRRANRYFRALTKDPRLWKQAFERQNAALLEAKRRMGHRVPPNWEPCASESDDPDDDPNGICLHERTFRKFYVAGRPKRFNPRMMVKSYLPRYEEPQYVSPAFGDEEACFVQ